MHSTISLFAFCTYVLYDSHFSRTYSFILILSVRTCLRLQKVPVFWEDSDSKDTETVRYPYIFNITAPQYFSHRTNFSMLFSYFLHALVAVIFIFYWSDILFCSILLVRILFIHFSILISYLSILPFYFSLCLLIFYSASGYPATLNSIIIDTNDKLFTVISIYLFTSVHFSLLHVDGKVIGWKGVENVDIIAFELAPNIQVINHTLNSLQDRHRLGRLFFSFIEIMYDSE